MRQSRQFLVGVMLALVTVFTLALTPAQAQLFGRSSGESDVGFLTRVLQDALSDRGREVRILGFRGALSSSATFDTLTIEDANGVWLRVTGATLQWNRSALLQRRIEIAEISAREIEVLRSPVSEEEDSLVIESRRFSLPELPVSVRLDALQIDRLVLDESFLGEEFVASIRGSAELSAGEGQAELQIERLDAVEGSFTLDTSFSNVTRELAINLALEEAADGIAVNLLGVPDLPSAALNISGEGPIDDFNADIALATEGTDRVSGTFRLRTGLLGVAQALDLNLGGDLRPLLQPAYQPFFGDDSRLRTSARRFEDGRLSLDDLNIRTQMLALAGRARIGLDGLPELIALRGQIRSEDGTPVLLPVPGADTTIDRAELSLAFDAATSQDWELVMDMMGFDNGDFAVDQIFLNGLGRITSQGFGEDIDVIDALVDFSALGITARDPALQEAIGTTLGGSLAILWREDQPLLLPGILLEGTDYSLMGRGQYEGGLLRGNVNAELENISRFSMLANRPIQGGLTGQFDGVVRPLSGSFTIDGELVGQDLRLDQQELDLLLAGESRISLSVQRSGDRIELRGLTAKAQTLRADVTGALEDDMVKMNGRLDFSDLSVLGGEFGGAMAASVEVAGPLGAEHLNLDAIATDLTVGQADANRLLRGQTDLRIRGQREGDAFEFEEFVLANEALSLDVEGRYAPGATSLDARVNMPSLGAARPGFGGSLAGTASLRETSEERAVTLQMIGQNLQLGNATANSLLAGRSELTASARQRDGMIFLDDARLSGANLNATVAGQSEGGDTTLQVSGQLANLALLVPGISGPVSLNGSVGQSPAGYDLDLALSGPAGLTARVSGRIDPELRTNLTVNGQTGLALINPRIEPRSLLGTAGFNVSVNGPLALASVSGTVVTDDAVLVMPNLGQRFEDITARATLSGGQAQIDLRARSSAGGTLGLGGSIGLTPPLQANLTGQLQSVRIINPQLYETTVSGDIRITGPINAGPTIGGTLNLDTTEIRIPTVGLAGPGYIPPDIQHLGDGASARATRERAGIFRGQTFGRQPNPPTLDLTINAPNRIFLRGRGLDAELGGTLRLTGRTNDIIPIGQFGLIRGRLDLLGNRFTLNEGFASLQGDFMPFVRLVASTLRDGVTARIVLEGRATSPEIRFESVPELPQEEVVSLLLFGRDFGNLSLFQAAQLASSLATLTGRGGGGVFDRLRSNVGLDELDIRTDQDGNASVRLGRYVTDTIYTDIVLSPEGDSEASINIDLTPSLTARGRVDSEGRSSVGLFFERDY